MYDSYAMISPLWPWTLAVLEQNMSQRLPDYMPDRMPDGTSECRNTRQIECHRELRKRCHVDCQIQMPQIIMPERLAGRMRGDMSNRIGGIISVYVSKKSMSWRATRR